MDTSSIRVLSLFSGAGGLDLAIRLALPSARTICYVERELAACEILASRIADGALDDAPIFTDICAFDGRPWRGKVDLILGGFPCTDLSVAGNQEGIEGEHSGLWFEYARLIREIEPGWVFIENVPPVLHLDAGRAVFGELSKVGMDAVWGVLPASAVGTSHKRERAFFLAYREGFRWREGWSESIGIEGRLDAELSHSELAYSRCECNQRRRRSAVMACACSPVEGEAYQRQRCGNAACGCELTVVNTADDQWWRGERGEEAGTRPNGIGWRGSAIAGVDVEDPTRHVWNGSHGEARGRWGVREAMHELDLYPPGPGDTDAWRRILAEYPYLAPAIESGLCVLVDDVAVVVDASRTDQLRAGGNGVVALQGAAMFIELARRVAVIQATPSTSQDRSLPCR